ncbi:hypothetical protein LguiA_029885 [Lonicera macranthoides]
MQKNEQAERICNSVSKKLDCVLSLPSQFSIFRVHDELRKVNEEAYEPHIIAIGPYHHGKANLQMMEEQKLRYLKLYLQRKGDNVQRYIVAMQALEEETRRCYAELISLNSDKFVEMMLLDGCFIVELLRKFQREYLREKNDPIFGMDWICNSLQRDLLLFENQLSFFVLCKLFDMIEVPNQHHRFSYLALRYFGDILPGCGYGEKVDGGSQYKINHLLGLVHINWLPSFSALKADGDVANKKEDWQFIPCATELREVGIKFEKMQEGNFFDIKFRNGVMRISPLTIEDRTESFFRNLIAYEQYSDNSQFKLITDYVKVMDCLINSPKDVELLCRHGIIDNWLGDAEAVSAIFNKITDSVTVLPNNYFHYAGVFDKVNTHCSKRWNRWMAKLRRNYLNSPWAIISISAAFVLLVLTFIQTVVTIKN